MHSSLNRLQTSFGFFTTCAFTLAGLIAFISLLPLPTPPYPPSATIVPRDIQVLKGRPHYYSSKREEYTTIRFDLDADLSPLFNWNTKQLFVYVTANYPTTTIGGDGGKGTEGSESIIWDLIIPAPATPYSWQNIKNTYFPDAKTLRAQKQAKSKQKSQKSKTGKTTTTTTDLTKPGKINLKNQKPKYQITDPSGLMAGRHNVTLQVSWNVQPWVGALVWDKGYLGSRVGSWRDGKVGRSRSFDLPGLKGAAGSAVKSEVVKEREPKTPEAGEGKPLTEI